MGSRRFQNNLSSQGEGREVGAHEYPRARPAPPPSGLQERSGRRIGQWRPKASLAADITHLGNGPDRSGGTARAPAGCAESPRARTPTTNLPTLQSPQPRPEMEGKDGSAPGRRGHHVQLPTNPSPLCGPPRPGLVAEWGKARRLNTEGKKRAAIGGPLPPHLQDRLLGTTKPRLWEEETQTTLKGSQHRKA